MRARVRLVVVGLLAMGLGLGLAACMEGWFTPQQIATLIVGGPVAVGGKWEVILSVANMSDGGLASMAVDVDGLTYNAKISNVVATGLKGFTVLAGEFSDATGKGRFVIANAATGIAGGTILKLTFDANAAVVAGDIAFVKAKITLGSHLNTLITAWTLGTTKAGCRSRLLCAMARARSW